MSLLQKIKGRFLKDKMLKETNPEMAYDLWAQTYDAQPDNLMLALDNKIFSALQNDIQLEDKKIVDIGCGTGRHWPQLLLRKPAALLGYDVSIGMLNKLKTKFPSAEICQLSNNYMPELADSCKDVIISTLTIAHIQQVGEAFLEWNRILKDDGEIIITDYHPVAFMHGGNRTFTYNGRIVAIKNYIHTTEDVLKRFYEMNFELVSFIEQKVDISMKHFYEEKNALHVFEKFKDIPIIYGMHLKKKNAAK